MSYAAFVLDAHSLFSFYCMEVQQLFLFSVSFSINLLIYYPFFDGEGLLPDPGTEELASFE